MQRHNAPCMPSRICASVGFGFLSSSTFAVRICPFWQKPHCGTCSSIHACCTGWSVPFLASPSSVVISAPAIVETGLMHDRTASPLIRTMHAPHCPRPQPKRGPDRSRSFRRTYSRGVEGSTSTVCALPFTRNVMAAMPHSLARVAVEKQVTISHNLRARIDGEMQAEVEREIDVKWDAEGNLVSPCVGLDQGGTNACRFSRDAVKAKIPE